MDTFEYRPENMAVETVMRTGCAQRPYESEERGHVWYDLCDEHQRCDLEEVEMSASGRLLDVNLTLKNVCPGRRVALGVTVNEKDSQGREYARGFKAVTVPAHGQSSCCDVQAPTLRFILPEDLRTESSGSRHFVVRSTTHYVDSAPNL
ncbi:MAG: hypothetical protein IJF65_06515 [Clostridia bacterium]|nr:hypothetical protein [Clostridia bacterium]